MTTFDYPKFRCPVCGGRFYEQVVVAREGRPPYRTPFLSCNGCSVMFRDPEQFSTGGRGRVRAMPAETWGIVVTLPTSDVPAVDSGIRCNPEGDESGDAPGP